MDVWYAIVHFFENGGAFMYPIVLILALGVAIGIERWVTLTLVSKKNQATWDKLEPMIK